jgi:group I intron endonuclease
MLLLTDKDFRKLPGIYIFRNIINGKEYIGQSMDIKYRFVKHKCDRRAVIHKAFIKYGIENFQVYVEYFPNATDEELGEMEKNLIKECCTMVPNGYNVAEGGVINRGWKMSDDAKKHLSKINKGKPSLIKKMVSMFTKSGDFVKTFDSIKSASVSIGILSSGISACCTGIQKSAGGYVWKFDDGSQSQTNNETYLNLKTKKVSQFSKDNVFIKTWDSASEAGRNFTINRSRISACCTGRKKSTGGFIWKYADDNQLENT